MRNLIDLAEPLLKIMNHYSRMKNLIELAEPVTKKAAPEKRQLINNFQFNYFLKVLM